MPLFHNVAKSPLREKWRRKSLVFLLLNLPVTKQDVLKTKVKFSSFFVLKVAVDLTCQRAENHQEYIDLHKALRELLESTNQSFRSNSSLVGSKDALQQRLADLSVGPVCPPG